MTNTLTIWRHNGLWQASAQGYSGYDYPTLQMLLDVALKSICDKKPDVVVIEWSSGTFDTA